MYIEFQKMYNMKKCLKKSTVIVVLALGTFVFNNNAAAQKLVFLFGHGVYATPVENSFKDGYNAGFGAEGGVGFGWNKTFIIGTIGYTSFGSKSGNSAGNINIIPLKAGVRQYILGKLLYIHGDVGIASVKNKITDAEGKFCGDFGAGVKFAGLEVQLDYDGFNKSNPSGFASAVALKAGFAIGL